MELSAELCSIRRTRRLVNGIIWILVAGATVFSVMTSTPLVQDHSQWKWSGWILGALTDAALVLSLSADSVLSRHGVSGGRWTVFFRWTTGAASVFLNVTDSAIHRDGIGIAIHSIAPVLLIGASEAAPIYRRAFRDLEVALTGNATTVTRNHVDRNQERVTSGTEVTRNQNDGVTSPPTGTRNQERVTGDQMVTRNHEVTGEGADVAGNHATPENPTDGTRNQSARVTSKSRNQERVTSGRNQRNGTRNQSARVTSKSRNQERVTSGTEVTRNQRSGVRECFDKGLSPTDAAKELGVSRPYVSKQYKTIRESLE